MYWVQPSVAVKKSGSLFLKNHMRQGVAAFQVTYWVFLFHLYLQDCCSTSSFIIKQNNSNLGRRWLFSLVQSCQSWKFIICVSGSCSKPVLKKKIVLCCCSVKMDSKAFSFSNKMFIDRKKYFFSIVLSFLSSMNTVISGGLRWCPAEFLRSSSLGTQS